MTRMLKRCLAIGTAFSTFWAAGPMALAAESPPEDVLAKLTPLDEPARTFLLSERPLSVVPSRKDLYHQIRRRSPEEARAYLSAIMDAVASYRFDPANDKAAMPLDTSQPGFNAWKVYRPAALEPRREPGPFSANRYVGDAPGIPTFFNLPVAINPDDLKAGAVDVAIVGANTHISSGSRGGHLGPMMVRTANVTAGSDIYTLVAPRDVLTMVDYGDIAIDHHSADRTAGHVREVIAEIAAAGTVPFIVGGDRTLTYSDVAGIADVHGKGKVRLIQFGPHDEADRTSVHQVTDYQAAYRLLREGHVTGPQLIQVGLRGQKTGAASLRWLRDQGVRYHTMAEVYRDGWDAVTRRVLAEAKAGTPRTFVSFDLNILDPGLVPGVDRPVATGLTMREAVPMIRRLCAETDLAGFELVGLDPTMEFGRSSALNATYVIHACLTGVALRKQGIADTDYVNPLSLSSGAK